MGFTTTRPRLKRRDKPQGEKEEADKGAIPKLSDAAEALISLAPRIRPTHVPTDMTHYQVAQMSSMNFTHEEIAKILGLTRETLYKYYRDDLDYGKALCTAKVGMRLFKVATEAEGREALAAMIFWLKTRAGWKENAGVELSGPDGAPIPVDMTSLSMEERTARVMQILNMGAGQLPRPADAT